MTTRPVHAARAAFVAAALVLAPAALAAPLTNNRSEPPRRHGVPEFDPAAAGALIALLAGGALHVANRRNSK